MRTQRRPRRDRERVTETDTALILRAMDTLGMTQAEIGKIIGLSQPAISRVSNAERKLSVAGRRELRRQLAWHVGTEALKSRAFARLPACRGAAARGFTVWAAHLVECPSCLVRLHLVERARAGAK